MVNNKIGANTMRTIIILASIIPSVSLVQRVTHTAVMVTATD